MYDKKERRQPKEVDKTYKHTQQRVPFYGNKQAWQKDIYLHAYALSLTIYGREHLVVRCTRGHTYIHTIHT
jgi:hypothetical protein